VLWQIRRCLASPHFQVCMRGLGMLDRPVTQALLADHPSALPPLLTLVAGHAHKHWHVPVLEHARALLPRLEALRGSMADNADGSSISSSQSSLESAGASVASASSGPTPMSICCTPPDQRIFDFAPV
jgi:hypothetical protein